MGNRKSPHLLSGNELEQRLKERSLLSRKMRRQQLLDRLANVEEALEPDWEQIVITVSAQIEGLKPKEQASVAEASSPEQLGAEGNSHGVKQGEEKLPVARVCLVESPLGPDQEHRPDSMLIGAYP